MNRHDRKYVDDTLKYYSNRMCLPMPRLILYTKQECMDYMATYGEATDFVNKIVEEQFVGANFGTHANAPIYVGLDLKYHDMKGKLEDTIIHELVHSLKKEDHDLEFYYTIDEIKKGAYPPRPFTKTKQRWWAMKRWWVT